MPIVAVVGLKGGSGKSLTTIAVAGELARRDRRVMVIDGDPNRASSRWVLETKRNILVDPFAGLLLRPDCLFEHVDRQFRIGIVDTPSNDRESQWTALMAADLALIPTTPGVLATDALAQTVELVNEARQLRPWLRVGVFVTRAPKKKRGAALVDPGDAVPDAWRLSLELTERPQYEDAITHGLAVVEVSPRSAAAREVKALATAIEAILPTRTRGPEAGDLALDPAELMQELESRENAPDAWAEPTIYIPEDLLVDL